MIPTKAEADPGPPPPDEEAPPDPDAVAREAALRARLRTRPVVTRVLLAIQLVVFVVELALGGSESIPVLSALGGLSHDAVMRGEVWRLVSCAFLHAGFLHVGLNSYVLLLLGTRVEQMLGSARYLVLYTASTIGAGLMATFTSSALVTVGASGGIFGLLAAEAIFVFTSRSALLPAPIRAARQRGAVINLFLNVGISLQPNVSLAAHAGGAIVGAVMILAGLAPSDHDTTERTHPALRALAALSGLVLAAALACGLALSGAPALFDEPVLVRRAEPALGWSYELPSQLTLREAPVTSGAVTEAMYGDIGTQPALVAIARARRPEPSTPELDAAELADAESALRQAPPDTTLERAERTTVGDRPAFVARYTYANGLVLQRLVVIRTTDVARIDTIVWPSFASAYLPASERTAASITEM